MRPSSVVLVLLAAACAKPKVQAPEVLVAQTADMIIVPVVTLSDAVPRSQATLSRPLPADPLDTSSPW